MRTIYTDGNKFIAINPATKKYTFPRRYLKDVITDTPNRKSTYGKILSENYPTFVLFIDDINNTLNKQQARKIYPELFI